MEDPLTASDDHDEHSLSVVDENSQIFENLDDRGHQGEDGFLAWDEVLDEDQENIPVFYNPGAPAEQSTTLITSIRSLGKEEHKQACLPARLHSQQARSPLAPAMDHAMPPDTRANLQAKFKTLLMPNQVEPLPRVPSPESDVGESGMFRGMQRSEALEQITEKLRASRMTCKGPDRCEKEASSIISDVCCLLENRIAKVAGETSHFEGGDESASCETCSFPQSLFQEDHLRQSLVHLLDQALEADSERIKSFADASAKASWGLEEQAELASALGKYVSRGCFPQDIETEKGHRQDNRDNSSQENETLRPPPAGNNDESWFAAQMDRGKSADVLSKAAPSVCMSLKGEMNEESQENLLRGRNLSFEPDCSPDGDSGLQRSASRPTGESLAAYQVAFFRAKGEYLAWQHIREWARSDVEQIWARKQLFEAKERFHSLQTAVLDLRLSRQQATELELSLCLQIGVSRRNISRRIFVLAAARAVWFCWHWIFVIFGARRQ